MITLCEIVREWNIVCVSVCRLCEIKRERDKVCVSIHSMTVNDRVSVSVGYEEKEREEQWMCVSVGYVKGREGGIEWVGICVCCVKR